MSDEQAGRIRTLGIAGAGFMGSGIAEAAARAGLTVRLYEPEAAALEASEQRIATSVARAVERGKLDEADAAALRERISWHTELGELGASELVIEAIVENEAAKAELFERLDGVLDHGALIASNTSSIPIAQLASRTSRPDKVLGLHFFSPVPVMKLVEIVIGLDTSEETVARADGFANEIEQDRDPHQGPLRLHRQLPARPLPDGRGAHVRGRLRLARGHRPGDEARLRAPDGAADALRLHRPRRPLLRSATRSTRSSSETSTRRRR